MPRLAAATAVLLLGMAPPLTGQPSSDDDASDAVALGAFFGAGSGPTVAATWGAKVALPIRTSVELQAEIADWDGGFGVDCADDWPGSYACDVSGWSLLVGGRVKHGVGDGLRVYGEGLSGIFSRAAAPIMEGRTTSVAVAIGGGLEVPLEGSLAGHIGARFLRPFDDDYRTLMGDDLQFAVGSVELEVRMRP